jgi:hypothetical protein
MESKRLSMKTFIIFFIINVELKNEKIKGNKIKVSLFSNLERPNAILSVQNMAMIRKA